MPTRRLIVTEKASLPRSAHFSVRDHFLGEGEVAERSLLQLVAHQRPISIDGAGADGSSEGRWRFLCK